MLTTREAILLKIESTYKTDPTPNPSVDAILVQEVNVSNEGLRMVDRPSIKPSIATDKKIFAGTLKKITFKVEIKGAGSAGTVPEIGQALRACGVDETIVPATSVTYQPVSIGHESATIYYYQDGRLRKLHGARGNVTINAEGGGLGTVDFEFTGHDGGLVDATFPSLSYDSTVPVPFIGVSFSVDSYPAIISTISLNAGNEVITPQNVREESGYGEIRIAQRDPNGTIDPEAVLLAAKNFESDFKTGAVTTLTTGLVGSTPGNIWKLDANIAYREMGPGERDQVRTESLTFGCHEVATDDEWTLVFT